MSKLWVSTPDEGHEEYIFHCPGCGYGHSFVMKWGGKRKRWAIESNHNMPTWTFNGDLENPSFSPSLLYKHPHKRCHLFVRNGMIEYLSDCDHAYAGKTIPMPDHD